MIKTHLVLVIFSYSSITCTKCVNVGYYTNKWMVQFPYGEIESKDVDCSQNMTYEGLVSIASQETFNSWSYRDIIHPSHVVPKSHPFRSNYRKAFNDNQWSNMWYFQDYRTNRTQPLLDMNIVPVYFKLGITGKNVNVSVVDTGFEWSHPELVSQFSPDFSWNYLDNNDNIKPNYYGMASGHGTCSAGIIIMQPNNNRCGVGVAYGATFGGIKVIGGSALLIATALGHGYNYVDVYSNSFSNTDSGSHTVPMCEITYRSISRAANHGRNGKGSVYVFAAGNGKRNDDHCSCDGYANSIYTIVVAACDDSGHPTSYSERCAGLMATSYSGSGEHAIVTTSLQGRCTNGFSGTSAATPIVAGVVALAFSMNPNLTWRDIMHLMAWTCQVSPLSDNLGWNRNKAGFYYSIDFGFGLINAYKLVRTAKNWKNVPKMNTCGIRLANVQNLKVTRKSGARIMVTTNSCQGLSNEVKFIEQIHLVVTMNYSKRGDTQIAMKSPAGTDVMVLESRSRDRDNIGLYRYPFLVLAFWGESPKGQFVIDIFDKTGYSSNEGHILEIILVIHGTKEAPKIYSNGPRPYDDFKLATPGQRPKFNNLSSKNAKYEEELYKKKYGQSHYNGQYYSNNHYSSYYGYRQYY